MNSRVQILIRELHGILQQQRKELRRVLEALRGQREAFISSRGRRLEQGIQALEQEASNCLELEGRRERICEELAGFLGLPPRQLTVSRLTTVLDGPDASRLELEAGMVRQVAIELEVERRVGETLLGWSSQCHEDLLRQLVEPGEEEGRTYNALGGTAGQDASARIFDAKV